VPAERSAAHARPQFLGNAQLDRLHLILSNIWRPSGTANGAEARIANFSGSTPADRREQVKAAFNGPPAGDALRILIATDAAREGLNLQRHCRDLFHLDLPWNPSRLEQRNGRIDRKLQPARRVYVVVSPTRSGRKTGYCAGWMKRLRLFVSSSAARRRSLRPAFPRYWAAESTAAVPPRSSPRIDHIDQSDRERRAHDDLEPVREADPDEIAGVRDDGLVGRHHVADSRLLSYSGRAVRWRQKSRPRPCGDFRCAANLSRTGGHSRRVGRVSRLTCAASLRAVGSGTGAPNMADNVISMPAAAIRPAA
jgi:superfamily II DNA/RNA helicase